MKSHWKYLSYVIRHKWFVFREGLRVGAPLWRLLIHDWTKFLPREWFPYVRYFYGLPQVGDQVCVDCCDGFGGVAIVIKKRWSDTAAYKVRMNNGYTGESQEFWAHNIEVRGLNEAKVAFDQAWNHHQKANPHHWQYWLLTNDNSEPKTVPLEMTDRFVREMVADWAGAGRAITGKVDIANWYAKNREQILLHPATRRRVESLLTTYYAPAATDTDTKGGGVMADA